MPTLAIFGTFGVQELMVILVIVVFLFGGRRIPELARSLGEGIRGFRTSLRGNDDPEGPENGSAETGKRRD